MGLKAAVQALQKAEILKEKLQYCQDLLNDNDAWACQQQLQKIYQQVLILDLEYALDKKVEQDLWNHGFKHYIVAIQTQTKDKKNPKRAEFQALLAWCLDTASGFYLMLLQEICSAFDLDLPFRRKAETFGSIKKFKPAAFISQPQKNSCHYVCQYCLVHLGDLARYRNASRQAEAFYRHAVQLSPSSGQPYNQLALLETSRGDKLSTVFHYVRSVAVAHPFPAASSNITLTFDKCLESPFSLDGRSKLSNSEYIALFLRLHAIFHLSSDFSECDALVRLLTSSLTAHIATEAFSSWKLVQMMTINMYAMYHITNEGNHQLIADEKRVQSLLIDLIAGSLNAFLLSVYTLKQEALIEYFALPVIKLTLDWLKLDPHLLNESGFVSRPQIWPSLCKFLNSLQNNLVEFNAKNYTIVPLPEDRDLQGFLPLETAFSELSFSNQISHLDSTSLSKLRASRLVNFGVWLASQPNLNLISFRNDVFEANSANFQPSPEFLQELKELSLNKSLISPILSPTPSTKTNTPVPPELFENNPGKRSGILKPGSLSDKNGDVKGKGRKNVAMQAILRKSLEYENKQVKFKTPSPPCSPTPTIQSQSDWCPVPFPNTPISCPSDQTPFFDKTQLPPPPINYPSNFHAPVQQSAPLGFHNVHSNFFPQMPTHNFRTKPPPVTPPVYSTPSVGQFNPWSEAPWFNSEERQKVMLSELNQNNSNSQFDDRNLLQRSMAPNQHRSTNSIQDLFSNGTWNVSQHTPAYSDLKPQNVQVSEQNSNVPQLNTYSLFSPAWGRQTSAPSVEEQSGVHPAPGSALNMALLAHQSLWSGPGPSPLERLLEQQKQLRDPKQGT